MDKECQRSGYDDTGRYHVPEPYHFVPTNPLEEMAKVDVEQIVHIPLAVQAYYLSRCGVDATLAIERLLEDEWEELVAMAQARLRAGYDSYGSEMYTWSATRRRHEVMEELADAVVYLSSGPIE